GQKYTPNASPENNDFYEYNPASDTWSKIADFPGVGRENGVSFEINGIGYMGLGTDYTYSVQYKDFWRYDPVGKTWARMADYPGSATIANTYFSCNGKGYVGLGNN